MFWGHNCFVDTGGLDPSQPGSIEQQTVDQAWRAINEADVLILVVDGKIGLTAADRTIMKALHATRKPIVVAVNKTERATTRWEAGEFGALGIDEIVPISALTGSGTGDLLELVTAYLPKQPTPAKLPVPALRIGLFGRPNVGKSSLMNALLGREEAIVSNQPHTTRDVRTIPFTWQDTPMALIDTAGLRRRAPKARGLLFKRRLSAIIQKRELEAIERDAVKRTLATLRYVDTACLLFPADEPLQSQDLRLAREIVEQGRALMIAITKWDTISESQRAGLYEAMDGLSQQLPFLSWVPIVVTSATEKFGMDKFITANRDILAHWQTLIPAETLELIRLSTSNVFAKPTSRLDARNIRIYKFEQVATSPPHLVIHMNAKSLPPPAFLPIVEKQLRKLVDLRGTPVKMDIQK